MTNNSALPIKQKSLFTLDCRWRRHVIAVDDPERCHMCRDGLASHWTLELVPGIATYMLAWCSVCWLYYHEEQEKFEITRQEWDNAAMVFKVMAE